ncbi:linear amide C-N hydrolase [Mycolicibacterium hodleri]|uniref:Linear amide C-N hydrolase n=1 Tax=Mycolicibacterium hodleri TaxID=49897 RepID=A0A502EHI5_9MYCO|nr:linear amide C-N hydrolase [Mycolicibacterium hodleri]TPG35791.1 linear amide C-N hydrolase [Mycolicibacterium hodleri]
MCTRVLWNTNDIAVLTGRTMDWPESTEPLIVAFPRGRVRDGGLMLGEVAVADNPLRWTSTYASLATSIYGIGTVDGFNERGFAAHGLYLQSTDVGVRKPEIPGLHIGMWVQYLLDQASSVAEALDLVQGIQLVMVSAHGFEATMHLAIEDAGGDSAILEFAAGELVVHHGRDFTLMTNDPTYAEQMNLLAAQDFSHPTSELALPGNVNAVDRFQRAAYYSALLPKPVDERQAVAGVMAIMRNVSVPFGAPYADFGVYNTEYRSVCDLSNLTYYFELTISPSVIWMELEGLNLDEGAQAQAIDPYDESLTGNVTQRFAPRDVGF